MICPFAGQDMRRFVLALALSAGFAAASAAETVEFGRYHALVIGINDYRHLRRLETAANDAKAVHELLEGRYGFQSTLLLNPGREALVRALDELRERLTERDNLLIYYAGHGFLDRQSDEGFWLPADAEESSQVQWVPVSTVTRLLRASTAKHALVIADSCYSGTLTRDAGVGLKTGAGRAALIARLSGKRARKAMTSGGLEPVNDGGGDGHSVFTRALLRALTENREVLDGDALFRAVRRNVVLNAAQTPEYSDIRLAGDEGGDFLFVPMAAVLPPPPPPRSASVAFLAGPEIAAAVVGKTLRLESPTRGETVRIHFAPGGRLEIAGEAKSRQIVRKSWWVFEEKALCRTYDRDNKQACHRLAAEGAGTLKFHKLDGSFHFAAEVLDGRRLQP